MPDTTTPAPAAQQQQQHRQPDHQPTSRPPRRGRRHWSRKTRSSTRRTARTEHRRRSSDRHYDHRRHACRETNEEAPNAHHHHRTLRPARRGRTRPTTAPRTMPTTTSPIASGAPCGPTRRHPGRARDGRTAAPRHRDRAPHDLARGRIGHLQRGRDHPRRPPLDRRPHRATRSTPHPTTTSPPKRATRPPVIRQHRTLSPLTRSLTGRGRRLNHRYRRTRGRPYRRATSEPRRRTDPVRGHQPDVRRPGTRQARNDSPAARCAGWSKTTCAITPKPSGARSRSARPCTAPRARWRTHWRSWSSRTSRDGLLSDPSATASSTSPRRPLPPRDQVEARTPLSPPTCPPLSR